MRALFCRLAAATPQFKLAATVTSTVHHRGFAAIATAAASTKAAKRKRPATDFDHHLLPLLRAFHEREEHTDVPNHYKAEGSSYRQITSVSYRQRPILLETTVQTLTRLVITVADQWRATVTEADALAVSSDTYWVGFRLGQRL